jgi:hypothetical protein
MYVAYAHVRPGTVASTNSPSGKTATTTGAATGTQADRGAELLSTLRKELGSAAGDDAKLAVYERISKQAEGLSEAQKREIFTTAFVSLSEQKQKDLSAFFGEVDRHERHKVELRAALAQEPSRAERELTLNHFNQFATSDEQRRELFTIFSESLSAPEQAELKTFFTEGERHERHKTELRSALQAQPDLGERQLTLNHFNQFATSDAQREELFGIFMETASAEERASLDGLFAALASPAPSVSYREGNGGGSIGGRGGDGGPGEEAYVPIGGVDPVGQALANFDPVGAAQAAGAAAYERFQAGEREYASLLGQLVNADASLAMGFARKDDNMIEQGQLHADSLRRSLKILAQKQNAYIDTYMAGRGRHGGEIGETRRS